MSFILDKLRNKLKQELKNIETIWTRHSVIIDHILNHQHTFDWNNIKIMDLEPNYNKRLISEMLHIKEQKNSINSQKDIELLDEPYFYLLDILSKVNRYYTNYGKNLK